ncbi:hypothetical protein POVCU2_0050170 [Plasmodium ovale curtisi]|uniref:Uncharacterized protein n=1 Tax=Plasmodium ovale curtisi TaxID=864141 RepID=A0A1A8W7F5_PLAOA|nr:hypothetical protein POVCU2_0050170 [Plasmodium ovale curtisi]
MKNVQFYKTSFEHITRICPDVGVEHALVNSGTKIEETRKGEREREREKKKEQVKGQTKVQKISPFERSIFIQYHCATTECVHPRGKEATGGIKCRRNSLVPVSIGANACLRKVQRSPGAGA